MDPRPLGGAPALGQGSSESFATSAPFATCGGGAQGRFPPRDDDDQNSQAPLPDLARSRGLLETRKKTRGEELERTIGRTRLSLTVVAVVVTRDQGLVNVDRVGDGLAETVTLENHGDKLCRLVRDAGEKWTRV